MACSRSACWLTVACRTAWAGVEERGARWSRIRAICVHRMSGSLANRSVGNASTASPISSSRIDPDGVQHRLDVPKSLPVPGGSQGHQPPLDAPTRLLGFQVCWRTRSTLGVQDRLQFSSLWTLPNPSRLISEGRVRQQIDVAVGLVLAAGDTAEHSKVPHPVRCGCRDHVLPVATYRPSQRPRQTGQTSRRPPHLRCPAPPARRAHQRSQRRQRRLPTPRLVRADDALRRPRPEQPAPPPASAQHAAAHHAAPSHRHQHPCRAV